MVQKTKGRGGDRKAESVLTRSSTHEKAEEKMQRKNKKQKIKNFKLTGRGSLSLGKDWQENPAG